MTCCLTIFTAGKMATGKRLLNLETMNQAVLNVKVPILGSVSARAVELQKEINQVREWMGETIGRGKVEIRIESMNF